MAVDSLTTSSATLYSATRGYDGVGNVISENTAITSSTTTDNQLFCYDEQNRLTWAGATDASPCNGAVSAGTLTSAYYSQTYSYDAQGRLTSGAIGSYTYGAASHPHAVTSIGGGVYTASYDAVGDLTCRAPNSSQTCAGTPTGATLAYDAERRLAHWQNTPSTPTSQDDYLYDGSGQRVEQYVNTSGTITSTAYLLGGVEEVSGGVVTKYLGAKGVPTAVRVGTTGSLNYLATDGLGSVSVAVDGSGNVVASQLFGPYGASRYSSGTMPTSKGFTGQRADAATGLDYYEARYYDPAAGQFTSADSVVNGPSRYAYVGGNPETATDPSGHLPCAFNHCGGSGGGSGGCVRNCGSGGSGGSGGTGGCQHSGGGSQSCTEGGTSGADPCANPQSAACLRIKEKAWESDAKSARDSHLFAELLLAASMILAGGIIAVIGDYLIFKSSNNPLEEFTAVMDALATISKDVVGLVLTIAPVNSVFRRIATQINGWVEAAQAVLHGVAAAIEGGGALAVIAWNGIKSGVNWLFGTSFSVSEDLAESLTGGAVGHFISAGGHGLAAEG